MHSRATQRFAELSRRRDQEIDVAEGALLIAAEQYPDLDIDLYLARLDAVADTIRPQILASRDVREQVDRFNHALFEVEGFSGNHDAYDDPRNSFLNEVIDRRTGIPITLSIVYVEIARRLGLRASGIGFPGHFLAKIEGALSSEGNDEIVVDPFFGRIVSLEECQERLRRIAGNEVHLAPDALRSATPREILGRMLNNLKSVYLQRRLLIEALACIDRLLLLHPRSALEYRDRGLLHQQLGCPEAAVADFERFIELVPQHRSASAIREALPQLRRMRSSVH
jgi:regulator of sirC expression with transglutaminase-like and TPR domain